MCGEQVDNFNLHQNPFMNASKVVKSYLVCLSMDFMPTKFQVIMSKDVGVMAGWQVWLILLSRQSCDTLSFNRWFASMFDFGYPWTTCTPNFKLFSQREEDITEVGRFGLFY